MLERRQEKASVEFKGSAAEGTSDAPLPQCGAASCDSAADFEPALCGLTKLVAEDDSRKAFPIEQLQEPRSLVSRGVRPARRMIRVQWLRPFHLTN